MNKEEQALKINEEWMQSDTDDSLEIFAYKMGRADLKKEYEDIVIGLTKEEVRRIKEETRFSTIDECISKIKAEWSYYDNTCYEICNELEKLKEQK